MGGEEMQGAALGGSLDSTRANQSSREKRRERNELAR
jgi:hypothetical protein